MKIYLGTDHRGSEIEPKLVNYLKENGLDVTLASTPHNPDDDFVDFALEVAQNVVKDKESLGILICGTGIGMSIAANKVKGAYAARCTDVNDAYYSKVHNAANIICLGMENSFEKTCEIIDTFVSTKSADNERYLNRVKKIIKYEDKAYNEL